MLIGYARVSTGEQNLDMQIDALKAAGCERIFTDQISGVKADRPGLKEALQFARSQDTLIVWKLDRFGRSLRNLIEHIQILTDKQVHFKSLTEAIDTTTPTGKLIYHIFGSLAEFERDIITERTMAGLRAARSRGHTGGRPSKLDAKSMDVALTLLTNKDIPIDQVCKTIGVSRSTLYRHLKSVQKENKR